MGIFSLLFGKKEVGSESTTRNEFALQQANRLNEILHDSMDLASNSGNIEIRIYRLELAKETLDKLKKHCKEFPFIKMENLVNVERDLERFTKELDKIKNASLIDGKPVWEYAEDKKHDLDFMKKCCNIESKANTISCPAPFYFERVAILSRKEKNYAQEVEYCEAYLNTISKFANEVGFENCFDARKSARYRKIAERLPKAKKLLAKQQK